MPFYNFVYPRKWSKILAPLSTFVNQLGKQVGLQTMKTNHNDLLTNINSLSDQDDLIKSNTLSTFLTALTSSLRPNLSEYYKIKKSDQTNLISSKFDIHTMNDENNNNNKTLNNNSVIIDLTSTKSDECLNLNDKNENYVFTSEHLIWIFFLTMLYFIWFIFIAGISLLHVIIYLIIIILYLLSDRTRRLTLAILIYLTYILLYDALHVIPNYTVSKVHIKDIYLLEKKLFGIVYNGQLLTLNEFFKLNHKPFLDVFTGICYLNWIPIPLIYSLYLYRYKSKRDYIDFACTFLLTNILGFIIYYIIPVAPPWYIEYYGYNMNIKTPGNPAGFKNFDRITGIKIFSSMYSKNANIFAALPSLHAAYPLITVLYGSLSKRVWLHIGFVLFTLCVWFSAVYSRHHYVLDVLAGGTCALTAYIIYRLLSRIPTINRLLVTYSKLI